MTATIPKVQVYTKKNPKTRTSVPGYAGRIAVIGVFDTSSTAVAIYDNLGDAQTALGTDSTKAGCTVLQNLFKYGASSIIAVPIASLSTTNLSNALNLIAEERFDMVFVAGELTDTYLPIITAFCDKRYLNKLPVGYIGYTSGSTSSALTTTAALLGEFCYGMITQSVSLNDTAQDILQSAAYYAGVIAGLQCGKSMTQKRLHDVTALGTSYTFGTGDLGETAVKLGYTVFKCYDREEKIYEVVNSEQPNGYDLYINRVRDYVVREMALHEFLGERNNTATIGEVSQELFRVKNKCVDTLDLLVDIEYEIIRKTSKCLDVNITKLLFDDIITEIDVYVTIEVQ